MALVSGSSFERTTSSKERGFESLCHQQPSNFACHLTTIRLNGLSLASLLIKGMKFPIFAHGRTRCEVVTAEGASNNCLAVGLKLVKASDGVRHFSTLLQVVQ